MPHLYEREDGFSLVELMAATLITAIFVGAFFAAYFVMRNELYQQDVFFKSNRDARYAMDMLARDVKDAVSVVSSRSGDTTGNQTLILRLPSIDANGEPTNISTQFDHVVYKLDTTTPTTLIRNLDILDGVSQRNGGADFSNKVIAKNVNTLTFSNSSGTSLSSVTNVAALFSVNALITVRGTTLRSTQTQTMSLRSDVRLRNKSS